MPKPSLKQQLEDAKADLANARLKNQQLEKSRASDYEKRAELEQQVARLEGERNEARRTLDKETERMRKEVEAAQARFRQSERNLQRALGYIDRVTEGEPPLPGFRREQYESVGNISTGYVEGAPTRGPILENGEPYDYPSSDGCNDFARRFR